MTKTYKYYAEITLARNYLRDTQYIKAYDILGNILNKINDDNIK